MKIGLTVFARTEEELQTKLDWYRQEGWIVRDRIKHIESMFFGYCESIPPYTHNPFKRYKSPENLKGDAL